MSIQRTDVNTESIVDPSTGEILYYSEEVTTRTVSTGVQEDRFIKIYYDAYLQAIGCSEGTDLAAIIVAIGKRMTYSADGQIIIITKLIREDIAREVGVSDRTVSRAIKKLRDQGILKSIGGPRSATYLVSPFVMAKGRWNQVQALRLEYSKDDHKMTLGLQKPENKQLPENVQTSLFDEDP